jgi:O-antigen ligase
MLFVVLFAIVFLAVPGLQEKYLGAFRVADERIGMLSAQGFFDGPGPYSWFCAATFAVGYAAYLAFGRTLYLSTAIIAALFAVLSWRRKSMGGIVAMVILAACMQIGRDPASRRRAVTVLALALVVGLTILAPVLTALWQFTVHEYGGDPNSLARVALHYTSIEIARDHFPFGTGLASFGSYASSVYYSDVYGEYGLTKVWGLSPAYPAYITDTFWPMVLGQGGVVSLVPYLLIFGVLFRTFWSAAGKPTASQEDRFLAICGMFLILGSLLESTSSHIYDTSVQSALVMIPAGIAWARFGPNSVRQPVMLEPLPPGANFQRDSEGISPSGALGGA